MARSTPYANEANLPNPARTWHMVLGWTLLAVALLGLIPAAVRALHDLTFHLEGGENALHWILAVATLAIAYLVRSARVQATVAFVFATAYIGLGVLGFFVSDLPFWHVGVADNILHITLGTISLAAGLATRRGHTEGQGRRYAAA